ncbi:High-affinity choline transport protein [Corynebacterium comes]|uniref:High-affinity choline transport protein n=2 Tax=Corynebacterium comes TaxID=2675218 RepID=A0A6B8VYI3_9CORY|nr:High-affinity choline transport protein [Corynebacterium comes]
MGESEDISMPDQKPNGLSTPLDNLRRPQRTRREAHREENRPPASSRELSKGSAEIPKDSRIRVNWQVLGISSAIILAFSLWAIFAPTHSSETMHSVVLWIGGNLGWIYVLTVTIVIGFVIWVAFSREGSVRLGPDHSRPQYKLVTWVAMLFAAGVGIDMLFYSVTGPISHYIDPPNADPQSTEALQDSVIWTMFHYGMAGWAMYALLGMAMGYFAYRWGMPLSIRAALYPLLGKRVRGITGDALDIIVLVGTVMGVATSMGIGVVLLNVGFSILFGLPQGLGLQVSLVAVAVVMTIAACTSGVDKGIRIISELNLWVAAAMMLYILIAGETAFLLNSLVENMGRFFWTMPERITQTMGYELNGGEWMAGNTLFFWAFWLAWGPFVGLFLARISRGRTLREFVIAAITIPVLCDLVMVSLFGNSAINEVVFQGNTAFGRLAIESPERGWYALLEMFPGATFLIGLATLSGLLFYLTSANSGAMVMSNFSSSIPDPSEDGPKWLRIYWAVLTAVLTIAMLLAGGVVTMEYATLIFALPVTIVAYLVMFSFTKALRMEKADREGQILHRRTEAATGGRAPERNWRQRLAGMRNYPSDKAIRRFIDDTVAPALEEVAAEFQKQGHDASFDSVKDTPTAIPTYSLHVSIPEERAFLYRVVAVPTAVPTFGARPSPRIQEFHRLEVFTGTGSEGYDLYGLTSGQIIDDVIDRFEGHIGFLNYSAEVLTASVLTPPVETSGAVDRQTVTDPR